jgi:cobalt-zinc-cadmium efflux system protein
MAHDHDHSSPTHAHGRKTRQRLGWAFALTAGFMGVEVVGGWLSGSLALIADAGHMLTDAGALALAWYAARVAARPADARRSYGHDRMPVIAAFVNGLALIAIVGWIAYEAIARLLEPAPITALPMLAVAIAGLLVNAAVFAILHGAEKNDINVRGALLHVMGDLLGSVGAIIAAVVILLTGWTAADPILSLVIVLLIVRSAWGLVRRSGQVDSNAKCDV